MLGNEIVVGVTFLRYGGKHVTERCDPYAPPVDQIQMAEDNFDVYLSGKVLPVEHSSVEPGSTISIQLLIVLFVGNYCGISHDRLHLLNNVTVFDKSKGLKISDHVLTGLVKIQSSDDIPDSVKHCVLPAAISLVDSVVHSGMCSVLRLLVKRAEDGKNKHLLGPTQCCLKACAEVSAWTKFCEVDLPKATENFINTIHSGMSIETLKVPDELVYFENHLAQPPVISNISKRMKDMKKVSKDSECKEGNIPDLLKFHPYAEGLDFLLTDLILVACVTLIFSCKEDVFLHLSTKLPRVLCWYKRVTSLSPVKDAMNVTGLPSVDINQDLNIQFEDFSISESPKELIRQAEKKKKVSQTEIDLVFQKLHSAGILPVIESHPAPTISLDWNSLPVDVHPETGNLPTKRVQRKCQQLENLASAVTHIARCNDRVVDFCSGSGHLSILLAHLLPECNVVMVENKEESLLHATNRISKLGLKNITSYQCNLDYFNMPFDIGVCLHGCGVATDLVLQKCLDNRAAFVICPCCYGAIQNTHTVVYPRSSLYRESLVTYEDYRVLAHAADQTEVSIAQAEQGKTCMTYVDTDRMMLTRELGYQTSICTLSPPSCSPKNSLLIGVPPGWVLP